MPNKLYVSATPHIVTTPKMIYLQNVRVVDNKADPQNRQFFLYDKGFRILFEAETTDEKTAWLSVLKREIEHTCPVDVKLPSGDYITLEISETETVRVAVLFFETCIYISWKYLYSNS